MSPPHRQLVSCFKSESLTLLYRYLVTQALAELAVMYPINGAFTMYICRFVDPSWGFACGWQYGIGWLTILPFEISAACNVGVMIAKLSGWSELMQTRLYTIGRVCRMSTTPLGLFLCFSLLLSSSGLESEAMGRWAIVHERLCASY
jgi:hypothetical protein